MTNTKGSTKSEAENFAKEPELPQKLQNDSKGYYNRELMAKGTRIKTLEALLEETGTDLKQWRVDTHTVNSWEQHSTNHGLVTLFQVKASLVRRAPVAVKPVASVGSKLKVKKRKASKIETVLFMPDTQHGFMWGDRHSSLIPLHDYKAIDAFIQLAIKLQPDYLILLGDHADFAEWSVKYQTPPEHRDTTQPTLDVLHWHLKQLRVNCPRTRIIWIEGNHDTRIERAFLAKMQQGKGIKRVGESEPVHSLPNLLRLDELDIQYHAPYGSVYWLWDQVEVTHGSSASIEGEAKKATHDRVNGHVHRRGIASRTIMTPEGPRRISVVNPGTLARIDGTVPSATVGKPIEDWQQGAAMGYYTEGKVHFQLIPIEDGTLIFDGDIIHGEDRVQQIAKETGWKQLTLR